MSDDESDYSSSMSDNDEMPIKKENKNKNKNKSKIFENDTDSDSDSDSDSESDKDFDGGAGDKEGVEDPEEEEDAEENDSDIEIDEEGYAIEKPSKVAKPKKTTQFIISNDDNDDDEYDENYLQKFDNEVNSNYIVQFHPECLNHNSDEVAKLAKVVRDENNNIIDPFHKTLPFLTKYEKARVLGQRAKQIEGDDKGSSQPFVNVPDNIIDSYIIAELELREKKIPFIIKRPIPGGAFEYWHLRDLENIDY
jgi:DNA-directed RNA polymerase I, II, and III subunit RPABC2